MDFYPPVDQNDIVDFVNVFWRHSWYWSSRTWCVSDSCPDSLKFIYQVSVFHRKGMSRPTYAQSSHEFPTQFSLSEKIIESHYEFQYFTFFSFIRIASIQASVEQRISVSPSLNMWTKLLIEPPLYEWKWTVLTLRACGTWEK